MKTLKTISSTKGQGPSLKTILFILAFFSLSLVTSFNGNYSSASTLNDDTQDYCEVTDDDIKIYMARNGYVVLSLTQTSGSCNQLADTHNSYHSMVYIYKGIIVGHEDIP